MSDEFVHVEGNLPRQAEGIIPFAIEPIEAWRAWRAVETRQGLRLASITYRVRWPVRKPMRAHCLRQLNRAAWESHQRYMVSLPHMGLRPHLCPNMEHRCGIYALREEDAARKWASSMLGGLAGGNVVGRVLLWGRVLLYEHGYIAEYAYPLSISGYTEPKIETDQSNVPQIVEHLARRYDLEIEL